MSKDRKQIAFELYRDSKGEMLLKDIAEKVGASPGTVRTWKSRNKWDELIGVTKNETQRNVTRNATEEKEVPKAVIELNDNSNLTEQQKLFCLYYLRSFNATQSYLKAYKCSYETAMSEGSRSLRNPKIKEELTRLKKELQSEQYFTIQDIINEYAKQAFSNIKDITTFGTEKVEMEDGSEREFSYVRLKDDSEVDGTLIQEVKQGKDGVSAKLWDKQKAMDALIKLLPDGDGQGSNITIVDEWTDNNE